MQVYLLEVGEDDYEVVSKFDHGAEALHWAKTQNRRFNDGEVTEGCHCGIVNLGDKLRNGKITERYHISVCRMVVVTK